MKQIGQQGFIALMSAIIISVTLLLFVTTQSFTSYYTRFNALDTELKHRSFVAADACVDVAFLEIANDTNYAGNEKVDLNSVDHCYIGFVTGVTQKSFKVQATSSGAVTNLQIVMDSGALSVVSWLETVDF